MEVLIDEFRRNLVAFADLAMAGEEVFVAYKGRRLRIVPKKRAGDKLGRLTPMDVINADGPGLEDESWKEEMRLEWEKDWEAI
jgi:antitoxin (DNA-binding transcriptional repressor) of toxin-antitoxin stability system